MIHLKKLKPGKYGIVGEVDLHNEKTVYKISNGVDFTTNHEYNIMQDLKMVQPYCPHFCSPRDFKNIPVHLNFTKKNNPFSFSKKSFLNDVCFMESIKGSIKFEKHIMEYKRVGLDCIYSTIFQSLMALIYAQEKMDFTHYDLHSNNILMEKCDENIIHVYKFSKDKVFIIPTFGHVPKIIDFGFSFTKFNNNRTIQSPINFPQLGFNSNTSNLLVDTKMLLVSTLYEMDLYIDEMNDERFDSFRNIVENIFTPMNIDWSNAWDDHGYEPRYEELIECVEDCSSSDSIFNNESSNCMNLLQYGISLPLKENNEKSSFKQIFKSFYKEWDILENNINSNLIRLQLLKLCVFHSKEIEEEFYSSDSTVFESSILKFKNKLLTSMLNYTKFFAPKIDYTKLLCGLFLMYKHVENFLYKDYNNICRIKEKEISNMKVNNTMDVVDILDYNIPLNVNITKDSKFHIFDFEQEQTFFKCIHDKDILQNVNGNKKLLLKYLRV
jgi:hypothetical protein